MESYIKQLEYELWEIINTSPYSQEEFLKKQKELDTARLNQLNKGYANLGLHLTTNNKEYKNIYVLLKDLSQLWDNLLDKK